ncbi:MAG: MBL fold metallo-hydrolase [Spirochaetales bacterium]|nr:MBL fold metallo-hydrolase [Spirochaetales bacterium]MCF7938757.1 MBL fold metallo-hydrolase [Spirochaetales bacterium]
MSGADVNGRVLYQEGDHSFIWLGADPNLKRGVVQTNQYLIIDKGRGTLVDPGGVHLFSRVVAVVSRFININDIDTIIFSHQDPDVSSGIALWLGVTSAKIYVSSLWLRFLPHFGIVDTSRVLGIEDTASSLNLAGGNRLRFVPAHFLHSTGNYTVFDDASKIMFSGDIGAAVFPEGDEYVFVEDFDEHVKLMETFHRRYMAGNAVLRKWVSLIKSLGPSMICPQHGAIFREDTAGRFLDWLDGLRCGTDDLDSLYQMGKDV